MTVTPTTPIQSSNTATLSTQNDNSQSESERILCPHCKRTATNGIKCKGICVADSDY